MATSGNFLTSDYGGGGGAYFSRMIFEWWQTGSGISGSVGYHNISYHLKTYGGATNTWQEFYQGSMNVAGAGYSWGPTQAFGGGATVFGDYSNTLYTDSAGNLNFGASAQGGIYYNTINTSGSGSWSMDNIPLHATINGSTGDITDEASSYYITYSDPSGAPVDVYLDLPNLSAGGYNHVFNYGSFNSVSMASDITAIRTKMSNTNSTTIRYVVHDNVGGNDSWSWQDHTITIANGNGQANPTFSAFTYKDQNSATAAITGNDQYLIQGYSDLLVTIPVADMATPNKNAVMDHYTVTIGSYSNNAAYSSAADVTKDVGSVSVTGSQVLGVKAVDSRGNSKTVTQNVTVIPYAAPVVTATATRANGYDDALVLHVAGSVSPLTISGTDKNVVSSSTGVQYRVSEDGGAYGAWTNVTSSQTPGTGAIQVPTDTIIAAQGDASANHSYAIQVKIQDSMTYTTQQLSQPLGTPILFISTTNTGAVSGPGSVYYKGTLLDDLLATGGTGATGPAGSPGGATGPTGPQGVQGATGPAGSTGAGTTGATGPTGVAGATGAKGATGSQGATGIQGATGPQGTQGTTGPTGAAGFVVSPTAPVRTDVLWLDSDDISPSEPGATGATGAPGSPGGATGPTGPSGMNGATGPTGAAGFVVSTSAPARTDVLWLDSDDVSPSEAGATGATGVAGINGATGATGPQGTPGGATGPAGATGPSGATGAVGATGVGSKGSTGATGPQGATGSYTPKPRVSTITTSPTPAINTDTTDQLNITALADTISSMSANMTGTPESGQKLVIRIKDAGSSKSITWGSKYMSSGAATLLTATVSGMTHHLGFIYDEITQAWICIAADKVGY